MTASLLSKAKGAAFSPWATPALGVALWLWLGLPYVAQRADFLLCACVSLLILGPLGERRGGWRFALCSALSLAGGLATGVDTLRYFAVCFAALAAVELCAGRVGWPTVGYLLWISPAFHYLLLGASADIRLETSQWAAWALGLATEAPVSAVGNTILFGERAFQVDEGCAGLRMVTFSGLVALAALRHWERLRGRPSGWLVAGGFFLSAFPLCALANVERVVMLTVLGLGEDGFWHQTVGLMAVAGAVALPLFALASAFAGRPAPRRKIIKPSRPALWRTALSAGLLLVVAFVSARHAEVGEAVGATPAARQLAKDFDGEALVYRKAIPHWHSSDHHPAVCWNASGYELCQLESREDDPCPYKLACLRKDGQDDLWTAWWYEIGPRTTTHPIYWRWLVLAEGQGGRLVNVTAETKQGLLQAVKRQRSGSANPERD